MCIDHLHHRIHPVVKIWMAESNSSSFTKSIPASGQCFNHLQPFASVVKPIDGLMMVPINGLLFTPVNFLQPSIPNAGPLKCSLKDAGSSISINFRPVNCVISPGLPCSCGNHYRQVVTKVFNTPRYFYNGTMVLTILACCPGIAGSFTVSKTSTDSTLQQNVLSVLPRFAGHGHKCARWLFTCQYPAAFSERRVFRNMLLLYSFPFFFFLNHKGCF